MPTSLPTRRRGLSMLLVLVSLAMATILSASYLASRDNSAEIGRNITDAAAARWAAEAGLELTVAIIEADADWRTAHQAGMLLDDYALNDAVLDIELVDILTRTPPTDETSEVEITATATVGSSSQIASMIISVEPTAEDAVDVDLSEFAVFVSDQLDLDDDAIVTRWPEAPMASMGERLNVGTQSTLASSIDLDQDAAAIDVTAYLPPGVSGAAVDVVNGPRIHVKMLASTIPMPQPPDPGVPDPGSVAPGVDINLSARSLNLVTGTRRQTMTLSASSTLGILGTVTTVLNEDMILSDSTITIDGDATLVIWSNLVMVDSAIELQPGATLTLFVGDNVKLTRSYIGPVRGEDLRDHSGEAAWIDTGRIRLFSSPWANPSDTTPGAPQWALDDNSVAFGEMYAPSVDVRILDACALYGRAAASTVAISGSGALFYDPALDPGTGFTNEESVVFNGDGTIKTAVMVLPSLSDADLAACAEAIGYVVETTDSQEITPSWSADATMPADTAPTEPTPREIQVKRYATAITTSVQDWEGP